MNSRILELRKHLGLSQQEFADRIGASRGVIANIDNNRTVPSPIVISSICREFNVNPEWLKDGEDVPMFLPDDDPDDAVLRILNGADPWKKKIILSLSHMPPECWDAVRTLAQYYKSIDDKTPGQD